MPFTDEEIVEEQIHFSNVVATFEQYGAYSLAANNRRRKDFYGLPLDDQKLLEELGWKEKLVKIDEAIMANARFLSSMVDDPHIFLNAGTEDEEEVHDHHDFEHGGHQHDREVQQGPSHSHSHSTPHSHSHGHDHSHDHSHNHSDLPLSLSHDHGPPSGFSRGPRRRYRPTDHDMDKMRSTLKQFVRDWSDEGKEERAACYEPMKEALMTHFKHVPVEERNTIQVLVPGAGLGRLAYEVASLGFACQGNEFSHYMLLSSFFVLNRTNQINQHTIYPYVHSMSNIPNSDAMLRPITIPDALPSDLPQEADFSLVAGDFEEIYDAEENDPRGNEPQAGKWDAVLTCFFIDTAKNVVNYLRIIRKLLKPGGVWINLGPLLWHWENNTTNDLSIELDMQEVKELCKKIGFKLDNERTIDTSYTSNLHTMLSYTYHASFWTATPIPSSASEKTDS